MPRALLAAIALSIGAAPALAHGEVPAPAPTRIIGTALNVVDLARSVRFYTEGLGMKVATTIDLGARTETILMFGDDRTQPSILLMSDRDPATAKPLVHGTSFSRLIIGLADIDAVAARLTALGYPHGAVRDAGHGARVLMVTDPAGFPLELVQVGGVHRYPR